MKKEKRIITLFVGMALFVFNSKSVLADNENKVPDQEVTENSNIVKSDDRYSLNTQVVNSQTQDSQEDFKDDKNQSAGKDNNLSSNKDDQEYEDNDSDDEEDITTEEYEKNVQDFKRVSMSQVKDLLVKQDNQDRVMYIGRPTCYYCRQFSPDLKDFNKIIKNTLLYFDIDAETGAHDYAFKVIGIPGTPTTMRFINGKIVSAWIGGDKTSQELYDFLYSDQADKLVQSLKKEARPINDSNKTSTANNDTEVMVVDQNNDNAQNVYLTDFQDETMFSDAPNVATSTNYLKSVVNIDELEKKVFVNKNISISNKPRQKFKASLKPQVQDKMQMNEKRKNVELNDYLVNDRERLIKSEFASLSNKQKNSIVKSSKIQLPQTGDYDDLLIISVGTILVVIGMLIIAFVWRKRKCCK